MILADRIDPEHSSRDALNQKLAFEDLPPSHQNAFYGEPVRVVLPSFIQLFKITSHYPIDDKGRLTEWWCFLNDTIVGNQFRAAGYQSLSFSAETAGIELRDYFRHMAAVELEWNAMTYVAKMTIEKPTYALIGLARRQPISETHTYGLRTKEGLFRLPGGMVQVYVGGLERTEIRRHVEIFEFDKRFSDYPYHCKTIGAAIFTLMSEHPEIPRELTYKKKWLDLLFKAYPRTDNTSKVYANIMMENALRKAQRNRHDG